MTDFQILAYGVKVFENLLWKSNKSSLESNLQDGDIRSIISMRSLPCSETATRGVRGLILENRACVRYNQKRARKSSKRTQLWVFTPHFFKFRAFRKLHPPKRHVFLEFLAEKKVFRFAKRALSAGTARNKWLK